MRESQFDPVLLRLNGTDQLRVSESVVAIPGDPDCKMLQFLKVPPKQSARQPYVWQFQSLILNNYKKKKKKG